MQKRTNVLCVFLLFTALCLSGAAVFAVTKEKKKSVEEAYSSLEPAKAALTFDDGPNPTWTPKLLEGLDERDVKATFFVTGENAKNYPEIIKQMSEKGHIIGNHTYHHVQLTQVSQMEAVKELEETNRILLEITGIYPEFVRPPFGEISKKIEEEVDMTTVLWNVDPVDWATESETVVVKKVVENIEDNAIILLHDNYESSVNAALQIVDILKKQGYEFVTVEEILFD